MNGNNKISTFQFGSMVFFISGAQILNGGVNAIIRTAGVDAWITLILAAVFQVIPLFIFAFIADYRPDLNILEKNKVIYGKIIGNIINVIIVLTAFGTATFSMWTVNNFVIIKYLFRTPSILIATLMMLPILYGLYKGVEAIFRTNEIAFFINLLITIIIVVAMSNYVKIDNIKPILANGIMPVIKSTILPLSYSFFPLSLILIIKKNNLVDPTKYKRNLFVFSILGILYFAAAIFIILTSIGPYLASNYTYPEYYDLKEINFIGFLENVENFLSAHWFMFFGCNIVMCLYFIQEYLTSTFKNIKQKKVNIFLLLVAILIIIGSKYLFESMTISFYFMRFIYKYIAAVLFGFYLITAIVIKIKKRTESS